MEKSQNTSPAKRGESLLSQYHRRMLRERALLQDGEQKEEVEQLGEQKEEVKQLGKQKEEVEQLVELTDDLNDLFEHG